MADQFLMDGLSGKVPTPTLLLLLAGLIMVITLYTSKKAKSVVKTSLDLGRQDEGYERFSSFMLSRSIVRNFATMASFVNRKLPGSISNSVNKQFDQTAFTRKQVHLGAEAPQFDMIRASTTLVVASILIAIGTNFKLPLSTTYVTFMVFMGTSLADGAWGRESAVYRVSGVLSVIGGWFFTAFSAFMVAFTLAMIFYFGGWIAIVLMIILSGVVIFRTHKYHGKRTEEQLAFEKSITEGTLTKAKVIDLCVNQLETFLNQFGILVDKSFEGLRDENLTVSNQTYQAYKSVYKRIDKLKNYSSKALDQVPEHELEAGHLYMLVVDYLHEMSKQVMTIIKSNMNHVDNNHKPLLPEQISELQSLHDIMKGRYLVTIDVLKNLDGKLAEKSGDRLSKFVQKTREVRKNQIKRIKLHEVGTRNSVLYLSHLAEFRNLALFANRIVRVFDELILNPVSDGDIVPEVIKEKLEKTRIKAESQTPPISTDEIEPKDVHDVNEAQSNGDNHDPDDISIDSFEAPEIKE
jgi:hypothetical protein